jgi:hypothetical protein
MSQLRPTLVNAHLFFGAASDAVTTYRVPAG